jgi:hypothetical protein
VFDPAREAAKTAAAAETQRIKDRLMANPKLKKLAFETRREKQRTMRETVEQTRCGEAAPCRGQCTLRRECTAGKLTRVSSERIEQHASDLFLTLLCTYLTEHLPN